MDESEFETVAGRTLAAIMDSLDVAIGDVADVDMQGGVLTVVLEGGGHYVLNLHRPNRQIWLSSPVSGASHFEWDAEADGWRSTRGGTLLCDLLSGEIAERTGVHVSLEA